MQSAGAHHPWCTGGQLGTHLWGHDDGLPGHFHNAIWKI